MAYNHAAIQGRFVKDPELRRTTTGKAVTSFTLAVDNPGKDSGASFIDCVALDKTAEFINNYFQKGNAIIVEGRLASRQYEAKDGNKRTVTEVVVSQAHFCEKKSETTGCVKNEYVSPAQDFAMLDDPDAGLPF